LARPIARATSSTRIVSLRRFHDGTIYPRSRPVTEDTDARGALDNARDLAVHAEAWGYRRIWVAEHHNMPGIASAATSVVIGHIAAGTKTIRVGAGGIMLPNHAPYVIAEQFGTLARLFPGRIDLGPGRAPGTDQLTLRALRRTPEAAENFPQDVLEVQAFLAPAGPNQRIRAVPAAGTEVPLWILGSSNFGAMLAAELGLPYAFASHFAPELLIGHFRARRQTEHREYSLVDAKPAASRHRRAHAADRLIFRPRSDSPCSRRFSPAPTK
jgi:luciferase family oxidoreductase group 1